MIFPLAQQSVEESDKRLAYLLNFDKVEGANEGEINQIAATTMHRLHVYTYICTHSVVICRCQARRVVFFAEWFVRELCYSEALVTRTRKKPSVPRRSSTKLRRVYVPPRHKRSYPYSFSCRCYAPPAIICLRRCL